MKKSNTRRAFLLSFLSLILCFSMLLGTTYAWFTDSVTSAKNMISSGTLDVELYYQNETTGDTWTKVESDSNVFKENTLWEPGHTEVVKLKVVNEGSLALKYRFSLSVAGEVPGTNVAGETFKLSDYILFGTTTDAIADRADAIGKVEASAVKLNTGITTEASLTARQESELSMVVYMPETVGNEANYRGSVVPTVNFGLNLLATQFTYESDSFGNDYDAAAEYPALNTVYVPANTTQATTITAGEVAVSVPAGADEGEYKLHVTDKNVASDSTSTTVSYDISLYKDDVKVSGVNYPVSIQVGSMLDIVSLTHNGNPITVYEYDALKGVISFETDSFSPFAVTYKEMVGEDITVSDGKITGGIFEEKNPADIDPSLKEADSKYIAINYEKDGKTYYVVNERANTVILSASDTVYTAENGNYTAKNVSGKMYDEFLALQNRDFTTVYILPGTYNEGTTINVYSSVDVIGLGDAEDIKIIKTSSSKSNRHLFNCSGTKSDYIQVTLKNLYLDATVKTTANQDNAAVQCIRKTKVKCYDLIVKKGTGLDAVAFYVNGNNAVDGVKYEVYMYVENTVLNVTRTSSIVTTSGSYKFYHNGLTYSDGASTYTRNSGSIKNVTMEHSNWEW